MNIERVELGTVVHGTLRPQDLAPAFVRYAQYLEIDVPDAIEDASKEIYDDTYEGDAAEVLIALGDLIDESLPTFLRFGTNEGDGADWGVWGDDRYDEKLVDALLRVYQTEYSDYTQHIDALRDALDLALEQIGWHA